MDFATATNASGDPALALARRRAARLSVVVGVVMLGLKWVAYLLTGSTAILSDALESVVHVAATGFMFWCLRYSQAPPDADHPYGHGRAESLSIGFEGGMILLAALAIVYEAVVGLVKGQAPVNIGWGLLLVGAAAAVNLALGAWLIAVGRRTRSAILVADGQHVLSDVWTSGAILAGVGIMHLLPAGPARAWCDALVALAAAAWIGWVATGLLRQAVGGLLDHQDPDLLAGVVAAFNDLREPGCLDVHNLRLRRAGDLVYVDLHLVVPAQWSIGQAHDVVERLERGILGRLGMQGAVMIHLDNPELAEYREVGRDWNHMEPITIASATRQELVEPPPAALAAPPRSG